ncbi:BtaA family protein [bacterium SCSIO 12741]|nr:BtaA family protein [bacterium SCSIO 12741]
MKFKNALDQLRDKLFESIHTNNLIYNTCWEDPRVDRKLMDIDKDSEIVMITSAGCNALDYLLDGPKAIHCVDMNRRQNALLELKLAFLKDMHYESFSHFFLHGRTPAATMIYEKFIRAYLSPEAALFWDEKIDYFTGFAWKKKTFYYRGTAGQFAWVFRKYLNARPKTSQLVEDLLEADTLERQREVYAELEPKLLNKMVRWLMNRQMTMSMLGVPRSQKEIITENFPGGMSEYVAASLRYIFTELPIEDNYFWYVYLKGEYSDTCLPEYLKPENFGMLCNRQNRISLNTSTLAGFLKDNPGKYTHFVLLDHQDWLAAYNKEALEEEWKLILENSAPGAKFLLRSAHAEPDFIPDFVWDACTEEKELVDKYKVLDRVGTYAGTLMLTRN